MSFITGYPFRKFLIVLTRCTTMQGTRLKPDLHIMSKSVQGKGLLLGYCSASCNYAGHCRQV